MVICATALIDSSQAVVGVATADLDGAEPPEVLIDEHRHGELAELLRGALDGRVSARRRR